MSHPDEEVWVVTGANRGIGLEYVQQVYLYVPKACRDLR